MAPKFILIFARYSLINILTPQCVLPVYYELS
jgi:hypothetical protein